MRIHRQLLIPCGVASFLAVSGTLLGACPAGRVMDDAGHPVLKAEIYLNGARVGESGPDGSFRIDCAKASAPFMVRVESDDYEPLERVLADGDSLVKLIPDTALRGRLRGDAGMIAGVTVGLLDGKLSRELFSDDEEFSPKPLAQAVSSPGGRFRFPGIKSGKYRLLLEAPAHPGILSESLTFQLAAWKTRDFSLPLGVTLSGRITAASQPIAGAMIRPAFPTAPLLTLMQHPDGAIPVRYFRAATVHTGADGRFTLAALPAGQELALFVTHPGYAPLFKTALKPDGPVELILGPGGTVTGHVRAKTGAPLAGLTVKALPALDSGRWVLPGKAPEGEPATLLKADPDGIPYRADRVMAGEPVLVADAPGFTPVQTPLRGISQDSKIVQDFTLERGWRLTGEVVNEKGAPLSGAVVMPMVSGGKSWDMAGTPTASRKGRFDLPGLKQRTVDLKVAANGYAQVLLKGIDAETSPPLRIALQPGAVVSGQVVDESNRPVTEFTVDADGEGFMSDEAVVNEEGRFEVTLTLAETRSLRILVPGRAPITVGDLSLKAGDRRDLGILSLTGGARLSGRVLDEQEQPVEGAKVTAHLSGDWRNEVETTSDRKGAFELADLKPGRYELNASHPRFTDGEAEIEVNAERAPEPVTVKLKNGLRLVIELQNEAGRPATGEMIMGEKQALLQEKAPGRYEAEGIEAGKVVLFFLTPPQFSRVVELAPGAASPLRIRRGRTRVEGVVRRGGQPAANEKVQLAMIFYDGDAMDFMDDMDFSGMDSLLTVTDASGRFRWTDVPNGDYTLRSGSARKRLSLGGAADMTADLELSGGGLKGCVVDAAAHRPLAGVHASFYIESNRQKALTDSTGCYRFDGIPPGEYEIDLVYGSVSQSTETSEVVSDLVVVPTVEMAVGNGRITVRISNREGSAVPSWCSLKYMQDGGGLKQADNIVNGRGEMASLPAGDYIILADCNGRATARAEAHLREPDGMSAAVTFTTVLESVLTVRLNDASGKLVERYQALAVPVNSDCPAVNEGGNADEVKPAVIENIPACDYKVTATTPDNKSASTTLHIDEGVTKEITLTLP